MHDVLVAQNVGVSLSARMERIRDDLRALNAEEAARRFELADQNPNKTCTVLVEVTDACNLACAVCYSDAKGNRKLPLDDFKSHITDLVAQKKVLDSVQITGGEAVLHPQFWEMVAFLHD